MLASSEMNTSDYSFMLFTVSLQPKVSSRIPTQRHTQQVPSEHPACFLFSCEHVAFHNKTHVLVVLVQHIISMYPHFGSVIHLNVSFVSQRVNVVSRNKFRFLSI